MKSKVEELKELGYDITPIIDNLNNPFVLKNYFNLRGKKMIINWNDSKTIAFSNQIYELIMKYSKSDNNTF